MGKGRKEMTEYERSIKELEQAGIVHNYPQLIEISHHPVSQAEHTFIKTPDNKIIITTR